MPERTRWTDNWKIESYKGIGSDVLLGGVEIDLERCSGCGICATICPSKSLEVAEKKCRMVKELPLCMACGDCSAICPEKAISVVAFLEMKKFFRYLDRGPAEFPRKF